GLGAMEGAVEDDAEHVAPLLERHLLKGALLAQRRVVDQIVDAGELFRGPGHAARYAFLVGHVEHRRYRLAAAALDLSDNLLGLGLVRAHVDDDRSTARGE